MTLQSSLSLSPPADGGDHYNFEFAFDSATFSDRVLKVEILADVDGPTSDVEWAPPRKRRRKEDGGDDGDDDDDDDDDAIGTNKNDKDDDFLERNETPRGVDFPNILRVQSVNVNTAILAAKSQFFFKLFSNGMQESSQQNATLRISSSEEDAFMELLQLIYGYKLSSTSLPFLMDLLMIADKFDVPSCMKNCIKLATALPMTTESALLYLNHPLSLSNASCIQPLANAAKEVLANKFRNISRYQDEVLDLPLAGIEAIFSRDDLVVRSEDSVYDLLVKWAHRHYPELRARQNVFASKLAGLIRFPQVSCTKLGEFLESEDLDSDTKLACLALLYKAGASQSQPALAPERSLIERAYLLKPVKKVEFNIPNPQCIIFLDLKEEDLALSETIFFGGVNFFLAGQLGKENVRIYLGIHGETAADLMVLVEFSVRAKPLCEFERKLKGSYSCGASTVVNCKLLGASWESRYYIDGILHLRAELAIKHR